MDLDPPNGCQSTTFRPSTHTNTQTIGEKEKRGLVTMTTNFLLLLKKTWTATLYGQIGKIKITNPPLQFKTSKRSKTINSGFKFEIDLVLENKDEIIIFGTKC